MAMHYRKNKRYIRLISTRRLRKDKIPQLKLEGKLFIENNYKVGDLVLISTKGDKIIIEKIK